METPKKSEKPVSIPLADNDKDKSPASKNSSVSAASTGSQSPEPTPSVVCHLAEKLYDQSCSMQDLFGDLEGSLRYDAAKKAYCKKECNLTIYNTIIISHYYHSLLSALSIILILVIVVTICHYHLHSYHNLWRS